MNWEGIWMQVLSFCTVYGIKIVAAVLILVIGRYLASIAGKVVRQAMVRARTGETLATFVGNITYFAILIFVVIAAISKLGVQTTSFVAIIGASGLAIGLALQGSLANFAAGVMIIIFHPFKVGDYITVGAITGTIHEIQIFSSIILTPDNKKMIVPNSKLTGDSIVNYSAMPTRRVDLTFTVKATDVYVARDLLLKILHDNPHVLKEPAPNVFVSEIAGNDFTFMVQPHVHNAEFNECEHELVEQVKLAFYELNKA